MSKFTKRELLLIGALGAVLVGELWQRRKLKSVPKLIEYYSRLSLAATRVAQNVRSLLDVQQILKVTIEEVVPAFGADQCVIRLEGNAVDQVLESHYPEDVDSTAMSDTDICRTAISGGALQYYVRQGRAREPGDISPPETTKPVMGAPISYAGKFLGTLVVRSDDPARIWSESEVQALLAIVHQVWEAVSQAQLFAEKEQQSLTDALTGCLNRRGFDLQLECDLRLAAKTDQPLSLVMVDIDHFKRVNDTYGHATGDQVLRTLATVLREEINGKATAARFGGEEFALILPQREIEEASALAERVRARVAYMNVPEGDDPITASFGIATFPLHGSSRTSLIESADAALYQAKNTGRNRVCTPQMSALQHDSA
jgi:diguanylate cyclase (GGDEF)-like protein